MSPMMRVPSAVAKTSWALEFPPDGAPGSGAVLPGKVPGTARRVLPGPVLRRLQLDLLLRRLQLLGLHLLPQAAERAHVDVGHGDQGEEGDQVPAPVVEQQPVAGEDEEEDRNVVAEAILAGEEVEELPRQDAAGVPGPPGEVLSRLVDDLLMRHRHRD